MKSINELEISLARYLKWHKARIKCFSRMLLSLFAVRTVNLSELAIGFASKAEVASRYKRLQRFFRLLPIDMEVIAKWIFYLFFTEKDKVYLILDRTNWYYGKKKLNVLVLSVAYEGLAIPLYWKWLSKAGNSKYDERINLVKIFTKAFGKERIAGILGDREFIGINWISWLVKEKIPFYFRIKNGIKVSVCRGKRFSIKKIFAQLNPKEGMSYVNYLTVFGQDKLRAAAGRSERGELLIVITNMDPRNAVPIYLCRWEIENLFKALKSNGFNFEATRMTNLERIDKLLAVVSVAFCWAHKIGEWRAEITPIRLKLYRNKTRHQESTFFRYGLNWLREIVLFLQHNLTSFKKCLKLLMPYLLNAQPIKERLCLL